MMMRQLETISLDEVAQASWISRRPWVGLIRSPASFTLGLKRWLVTSCLKDFERFAGRIQLQTATERDAVNLPANCLGIRDTTISIQTEDEVCTVDLSELRVRY